MIISHNLSAMTAYRHLAGNSNQASKALEKLSSGLRINRAGDDAAGLAISEKMRSQIRGLGQSIRNAQDGISLIQTAEGGAAAIHGMLQRGRELSVQAASDTTIDADRAKIQDEIKHILSGIDDVANNTEFNTIKLLNRTSGILPPTVSSAVGPSQFADISQAALDELTTKLPGWINDSLVAIHDQLGVDYPASKRDMTVTYYSDSGVNAAAASMGTSDGGVSLNLRVNVAKVFDSSGNLVPDGVLDTLIAHEIVHALQFTEMPFSIDGLSSDKENWFIEGLAMAIQGGNFFTVTDHHVNMSNPFDGDYRSAFEAVKVMHELIDGGISALIDELEQGKSLSQAINDVTWNAASTEIGIADLVVGHRVSDIQGIDSFIAYFNDSDDVQTYLTTSTDFTLGSGAIVQGSVKGSSGTLTQDATISNGTGTSALDASYNLSFGNSGSSINYVPGSSGNSLTLQIGANTAQSMSFQLHDLRTSSLGLKDVNVSTRSSADNSIEKFDSAIKQVSSVRSYYGVNQNRLEHSIANLSNAEENLTAAESRIRDIDMAKEMMNFQKYSILSQAAQAMLAQANQQPQGVLQLLR